MKTEEINTACASIGATPPDYLSKKAKASVIAIILIAADEFGVSPQSIIRRGRRALIINARHTAMAIIRSHTKLTLVEIATVFQGRNHTTIVNAVSRCRLRRRADPDFSAAYDRTLSRLSPVSQH